MKFTHRSSVAVDVQTLGLAFTNLIPIYVHQKTLETFSVEANAQCLVLHHVEFTDEDLNEGRVCTVMIRFGDTWCWFCRHDNLWMEERGRGEVL